jgi:hypothetical protein
MYIGRTEAKKNSRICHPFAPFFSSTHIFCPFGNHRAIRWEEMKEARVESIPRVFLLLLILLNFWLLLILILLGFYNCSL